MFKLTFFLTTKILFRGRSGKYRGFTHKACLIDMADVTVFSTIEEINGCEIPNVQVILIGLATNRY